MGAGVIEGAGDDLGRAVVAAHRVDRDRDAAAVVRAASAGDEIGRSIAATTGQEAVSVAVCLSSIAWRPWY